MDTPLHSGEKPMRSSAFLMDIVIGMSDGLIVPFALAAGLTGAVASLTIIVVAGVAAITAGSIAMAMGGYLAGKTEMDNYKAGSKKDVDAVEKIPGKEKEAAMTFFAGIGLSQEMQDKATEEITNDKKQWVDFLLKYELGPGKPDPKRAAKSAANIGLSYAVGGLVPLSPYFFTDTPADALKISAGSTLLCLFIFGFFRSWITGVNPWWGAIRVTLMGALAAIAAFGAARLFVP